MSKKCGVNLNLFLLAKVTLITKHLKNTFIRTFVKIGIKVIN